MSQQKNTSLLAQWSWRRLWIASLTIFALIILGLTVRGNLGNPTSLELNSDYWKDDGPLELSPDRGRFALTMSLLEDHSYYFSKEIAQFVLPDVAEKNGHYVSLFAPTVSYLIMPGYLIGKYLGISQVGAFAMIALFALFNFILIRSISIKLGAHPWAAQAAGLLFIFASPAFAYSVTLYQHHISTFIILFSIYTLMRWKSNWYLTIVWFLCALSVSIDNPNLLMMIPIGLFALGRFLFIKNEAQKVVLKVKPAGVVTLLIMILPILFFGYFNLRSYGNPFQLAGTVPTAKISETPKDVADVVNQKPAKNAVAFFEPRNLPLGFYEHILSRDRGMLFFTPIMLAGFLGLMVLYRKNPTYARLLLAVLGINILLYSMWGDPYGGWAFGSRYLIPTYAIAAILLALLLTQWRKKILVLLILLGLSLFSIEVNTIGAVTSNRNPPKVEVLALEAITHRQERFSFDRNMEYLNNNRSKSFVFNTYLKNYISAWVFTNLLVGSIGFIVILHYAALFATRHD